QIADDAAVREAVLLQQFGAQGQLQFGATRSQHVEPRTEQAAERLFIENLASLGQQRRVRGLAHARASRPKRCSAARAIGAPHSCTKWPPSATSIGGAQLRMVCCSERIGTSPSTGSFMPIAMKLSPVHSFCQNSRARRLIAAPGASSPSGTRFGNAFSAAL